MNLHAPFARSAPVKLTVDDYLRLRERGSFSTYSKVELLNGELFGVPNIPEDDEGSDESFPLKLSIDDFVMLDTAGAFASYGSTELLDGVVYAMSPEYRPHAYVKDELQYLLRRGLEESRSVFRAATGSVALSSHDMPMPDIVLTDAPRGPGPIPGGSVVLVIEVSSTTLVQDSVRKAELYAREGVPEYWVVDVNGAQIHQLWAPTDGAYAERRVVPFGERVASATIAGLAIATDTLA